MSILLISDAQALATFMRLIAATLLLSLTLSLPLYGQSIEATEMPGDSTEVSLVNFPEDTENMHPKQAELVATLTVACRYLDREEERTTYSFVCPTKMLPEDVTDE